MWQRQQSRLGWGRDGQRLQKQGNREGLLGGLQHPCPAQKGSQKVLSTSQLSIKLLHPLRSIHHGFRLVGSLKPKSGRRFAGSDPAGWLPPTPSPPVALLFFSIIFPDSSGFGPSGSRFLSHLASPLSRGLKFSEVTTEALVSKTGTSNATRASREIA